MRRFDRTAPALILAVACIAAALPLQAARQLPVPDKLVLKNGLTVYHFKNPDVPLVSFRMLIGGAGSAAEPASAEGAAGRTAEFMM
jgi:predicted Zn-dependent peptidase